MIDQTVDVNSDGTNRRERIGVFGGTFDPIHIGHLIVAAEALHTLKLDRLLFVPAGRPPHKPGQIISSGEDRCAMIRIAIDGRSSFDLSEMDLGRPGPSYSVDLLAILQEEHAGSDLFFVVGADSLRDLHSWHEPNRIPTLATLVVAGRPGVTDQGEEILASIPEIGDRLEFIDIPLIDVSSTDIRQRVRDRRPIWYQVPPGVEQYISERKLYR